MTLQMKIYEYQMFKVSVSFAMQSGLTFQSVNENL